jgi:mRNA-degrading endonuclease RelE of RelBE toxin-antitoxin system
MQPYQIEIRPSVTMRLNSLSQAERNEVMSDIERLAADPFPPAARNTYLAAGPLDGETGQVFVLKTLGRLRVLYTVRPDRTVVVMTIANQDLADRYFRTPLNPAGVG